MDIKQRLADNEHKLEVMGTRLQQMEQDKQQMFQEILQTQGENRVLQEMLKEGDKDGTGTPP